MFLDDLILNLMRARVVIVIVRVRMISDHGAREKSRISTLRVVIVSSVSVRASDFLTIPSTWAWQ